MSESFASPSTVAEAVRALASTEGARAIAGGTDLLVQMRRAAGSARPRLLVSLHRIEELRRCREEPGRLCLGAGLTLAELETSPLVRKRAPLVADAAASMASPHVRSRATLGGNICNASPAADLAPALLVHEARAILSGPKGDRAIALSELLLGPGKVALGPAEIVREVEVPFLPPRTGTAWVKHQAGAAAGLSIASVAAAVRAPAARCEEARVALGAVAPTAIRVAEVERILTGAVLSDAVLAEAGARAASSCAPIDDVRSTCDHRCHLVGVLVERAVRAAVDAAARQEA